MELKRVDEFVFLFREGAYFDEDDVLRDSDGKPLPDGLYRMDDGSLLAYEGNFMRMPLD